MVRSRHHSPRESSVFTYPFHLPYIPKLRLLQLGKSRLPFGSPFLHYVNQDGILTFRNAIFQRLSPSPTRLSPTQGSHLGMEDTRKPQYPGSPAHSAYADSRFFFRKLHCFPFGQTTCFWRGAPSFTQTPPRSTCRHYRARLPIDSGTRPHLPSYFSPFCFAVSPRNLKGTVLTENSPTPALTRTLRGSV